MNTVSYREVPFAVESLQLKNRIDRDVVIDVHCCLYKLKYYVTLLVTDTLSVKKLDKSAEHFAFQIQQKLDVEPELVEFQIYQQGVDPEWLRWRLQWVGTSPLHLETEELPINSKDHPLLTRLRVAQLVSLQSLSQPEVA